MDESLWIIKDKIKNETSEAKLFLINFLINKKKKKLNEVEVILILTPIHYDNFLQYEAKGKQICFIGIYHSSFSLKKISLERK